MGEYEPRDSRNVTLKPNHAPGEPPRTGPQEGETRRQPAQEQAGRTELEQDERGEDAEQTADPQAEQALESQTGREATMDEDADELDEDAGRLDRND
jgi:hypothetical protein